MKIEGDTLWVADIFAFREVDLKTGAVRDIHRIQASDMEYPFAEGLNARQLALTSWFTGSLQVLDRAGWKTSTMIHGLKARMDVHFLPDGSLVIAEIAAGSITRASGAGFKERKLVAEGLAVTPWGSIVVAEVAARRLVEVDPAHGTRHAMPENLPIDLEAGPGLPPPYLVTVVTVAGDGAAYFSADRNNAIYRVRLQRQQPPR